MTYTPPEEILASITKKEEDGVDKSNESGYTIGAEPCEIEDSVCLAKRLVSPTGNTIYYIKVAANKALYDFMEDSSSYRKKETKYRRVSKICFDKYFKFLKTKNNSWLIKARRDQQNG